MGDQKHPFFESPIFRNIIEQLRFQRNAEMKERNGRLSLTLTNIRDLKSAIEALSNFKAKQEMAV